MLRDLGGTYRMSLQGTMCETTTSWRACAERCERRVHATRQAARADVFDCIERFYNSKRGEVGCGSQEQNGAFAFKKREVSKRIPRMEERWRLTSHELKRREYLHCGFSTNCGSAGAAIWSAATKLI